MKVSPSLKSSTSRPKTPLSHRVDYLVSLTKWPSAWLAACVTPFLAWSLLILTVRVVSSPWNLLPFAFGCSAFVFAWKRWGGQSRYGRFLITLEHESTHALFALLTWHRIVGFKASIGRGGEVRYVGKGNWLITVAPYFFPTVALLFFLLAYFLPFPGLPWQSFLLGVALGYHVVSTLRETRKDQSDIQSLGMTFCWLFLPAANLFVIGLLISFAHGGTEGLQLWLQDIYSPIPSALSWLTGAESEVAKETLGQ